MADSPFDWFRIGHWTDPVARTGCTVVAVEGDVVASGEVRGSAPATREFSLLEATRSVESIDAVCLSGGSAFGLAAADGVMGSLRARGVGYPTRHGVVPIVVGMSLYDLGVGDHETWPSAGDGVVALESASTHFDTGTVGAGAGATVGKWRGSEHTKPGGLGFATVSKGEVVVSALVAVNAVGDLVGNFDPREQIAAGEFDWPDTESIVGENTTIGVIATNARLTKTQCRSMAEAGHDGLARAIVPAHGPADGDALVVVAKPKVDANLGELRLLAAVAVETAIGSLIASG